MTTPEQRMEIARFIVSFEARRDSRTHHIVPYRIPVGDGGGTWEVAGICDRYHPHETADLLHLIQQGRHQEAEERAAEYIAAYTDCASLWTSSTAVEAFLRDCVFNRGARGAARIFQMALGVVVDGIVGIKTRAAETTAKSPWLLSRMRDTREQYEREVVGCRPQFWAGLISRWNKALAMAKHYLVERTPPV